jgi:hypothetical protein
VSASGHTAWDSDLRCSTGAMGPTLEVPLNCGWRLPDLSDAVEVDVHSVSAVIVGLAEQGVGPRMRWILTVTQPGVSVVRVMSWSSPSGPSSEELWASLGSFTLSRYVPALSARTRLGESVQPRAVFPS